MLESIAKRVAAITSQQRSLVFKVLSLIGGGMIFLILFPFLLGIIGRTAAGTLPSRDGLTIRYIFGIPSIVVGLGILIYLTVYYILPWLIFPLTGWWVDQRDAGRSRSPYPRP